MYSHISLAPSPAGAEEDGRLEAREMMDLPFVVATEVAKMFFDSMFPSKGRRAIKQVTVSHFGEHKVIEAAFA